MENLRPAVAELAHLEYLAQLSFINFKKRHWAAAGA